MWCEGGRPKPDPESDACRVKQESLEEPCTNLSYRARPAYADGQPHSGATSTCVVEGGLATAVLFSGLLCNERLLPAGNELRHEVPGAQSAGCQSRPYEPTAAEVTSNQRLSWQRYFLHKKRPPLFCIDLVRRAGWEDGVSG